MPSFGFVYDERMLEHECGYDPTMAERPERMRLIYERLQNDGLLNDAIKVEAREATDEELLLNHSEELLEQVRALATDEQCEEFCRNKEILWMSPKSDMAARVAAGGCIELVKACLENRVYNGFAIVRPPGHHSYGKVSQGYCVFNNVAIAAKIAVERFGIKRVAVVDFDYHPGNGTYYSLKDDPRFHFTSFHAYHHGAFWPFQREFDYATGPNQLFVPLNASMNTEGDFVSVFHHLVIPVLRQFEPELILISAGFDAGYYDIMLEMGQAVKAHGFAHMSRLLSDICPGRTIAVLEGGYFPANYVEGAAMMVRALKRMSIPELALPERLSGALCSTVWNLLQHHSKEYPHLRETLEKLQQQQATLGLPAFVYGQELFFGEKMRRLYDEVKKANIARTQEWFPILSEEQILNSNSKIKKYIKDYVFTTDHDIPNEEILMKQLVWDERAQCDSFLKSAPFCLLLVNEFNDFVEGRIDHMMICDRRLYKLAKAKGSCEDIRRIDFSI
ncbi:unnamed protein product [Caenorhabditis auriculariae]|uniref:Histone deacetylase domain-containing protein n=1 Tax=Caenorhabditis auriculariae TaxID=2777116 RepID=A0A8S1HG74_9PELO|nr:unnamed protein product [Caenorhabditis auriculariae]